MKITITRALAELKLLDSRIRKEVNNIKFIDLFQKKKDQTFLTKLPVKLFETGVKAKYQSIVDLIDRRIKLKNEIMKSNAITKIKIAGVEYLVVEAIEYKLSIIYQTILLNAMKAQLLSADSSIDNFNVKLDSKVQSLLEENLSSDQVVDEDFYKMIATPFVEANEYNLVDPLKTRKKIEEMEKEIDEFISEVDFVLSESNARTEIEI